MNRRKWTFGLLAVVLAALCIRLGFWQLDRHDQRQAVVERQTARLALPPVRLTSLERPSDELHWRRVVLRGRWDFEREIVLRNRSLQGIPGVHVVTPFLLSDPGAAEGGSVAVLVRRGWLPAPDGLRASLRDGRPAGDDAGPAADGREESASAEVTEVRGIAMPAEPGVDEHSPPTYDFDGEEHAALIRLDPDAAAPLLPYRVANFTVQATEGTPQGPELRLLPVPELDDGPHLMYAFQWFSFAAIALVGITIWLRRVDG